MNKKEVVLQALKGKEVDRIPFSIWHHFGLLHTDWEMTAKAHIKFFNFFDLDWLKVMNDYRFPLPNDITSLNDAKDWKSIGEFKAEQFWSKQLKILEMINREIGEKAFFTSTIFSPQSVALSLSKGQVNEVIEEAPETVLEGLEHITNVLVDHVHDVLNTGASGIFYSVLSSYKIISPEKYKKYYEPFDMKVLKAAGKASFNILHLHGQDLFFNLFRNYPVAAINWSNRNTGPSLKEGEIRCKKCVIGGITEIETDRLFEDDIIRHVKEAIIEMKGKHVMIGPGCAIPPTTNPELIMAARKSAEN